MKENFNLFSLFWVKPKIYINYKNQINFTAAVARTKSNYHFYDFFVVFVHILDRRYYTHKNLQDLFVSIQPNRFFLANLRI